MQRDDNDRAVDGELPDDPSFDAEPMGGAVPWPDPVPLSTLAQPVPPFPVDTLGPFGEYAEGVADAFQVPIDIPALGILAAGAAVAAKRARVLVHGDFIVPLNLYTCVVASPSTGKSPAHRDIFAPIVEAEDEQLDRLRPEYAQRREGRDIMEVRLQKLRKVAAADPEHEPQALALAAKLGSVRPIELPRLTASDVTPERLAGLLAASEERLAVVSEEAPILQLDRYAKEPNVDLLLSAWDGARYVVDRQGRQGELLREPLLTLAVSTQPVVARSIADDPFRAGRGLPQRFLWAYPESMVGYRTFDAREIPWEPREHFRLRLRTLLRAALDNVTLRMGEAAHDTWQGFMEDLECQRRPGGPAHFPDGHGAEGWLGKVSGQLARVAGVLHVLRYGPEGHVDAETMEQACAVLDWARPHALKVFGALPRQEGTAIAERLLSRLRTTGCRRFSLRDAYRELVTGESAERARLAIRCLERTNHVRELPRKPVGPSGGQPPSPEYEVNPAVFADRTDGTWGPT